MMFKGTEKVSGADFSRIVDENGGDHNAFTGADYTAYFESMSAARIAVALELEADRMRNLILNESDFQTERQVVLEERRLRTEDNPISTLYEQLNAAAFTLQPYHWPIVGWEEDLKRLTLPDLAAYYRKYYAPNNSFIVAVGDFKGDEMLGLIHTAFGSLPAGEPVEPSQYREPPLTGERRLVVKKEAELPYVAMAFHVPNLSEPDSYVLEVIASVLSAGKSSRLYRRLVEEQQLALSAGADYELLSVDPSKIGRASCRERV